MPNCKNCHANEVIKSGKANGKQRYKCKRCGYHFVEGDARTSEKIAAKKALCVLYYSLGKGSYRSLAKIFNTHPSLVYRWIVEAGAKISDANGRDDIQRMKVDEMRPFIENKKANFRPSKPVVAVSGEPWPGCQAIVMLQQKDNPAAK